MKEIKKGILKVIATVLGFFGISSTFVACYGVPYSEIGGRCFCDKEGGREGVYDDGEGIQNLKVTLNDGGDFTTTDENGCFYFDVPYKTESATVTITDVDGNENGSFVEKTITIDSSKHPDISMEKAEK